MISSPFPSDGVLSSSILPRSFATREAILRYRSYISSQSSRKVFISVSSACTLFAKSESARKFFQRPTTYSAGPKSKHHILWILHPFALTRQGFLRGWGREGRSRAGGRRPALMSGHQCSCSGSG